MKKITIGFLGNDYIKTTSFIENIINKTNAKIDQEHIKMNIIINNKLLNKDKDCLIETLRTLQEINTDYLCLCFNNENIFNFIKNNTEIKLLNDTFNLEENILIDKILKLHTKEVL